MNMEQMIKDNMKDGRSMDEIAKAFTEAMNRVKNEPTVERNKYLNSLEVDFDDAYVKDTITLADIAKYAAVIAARTNEKWTKKEIETYESVAKDALINLVDIIDKDPIQMLMNMFEDIKPKPKVQVQIAQPKDKIKKFARDPDAVIKSFLDSLDQK